MSAKPAKRSANSRSAVTRYAFFRTARATWRQSYTACWCRIDNSSAGLTRASSGTGKESAAGRGRSAQQSRASAALSVPRRTIFESTWLNSMRRNRGAMSSRSTRSPMAAWLPLSSMYHLTTTESVDDECQRSRSSLTKSCDNGGPGGCDGVLAASALMRARRSSASRFHSRSKAARASASSEVPRARARNLSRSTRRSSTLRISN